ncbi:spermidine/putrescine ABC transporter permease [Pseudovibrio japonicus]|uniref:Spermidine/putrescine ABC transporter permease n=1 Tax=Pseudovibrio japonicus TaxID=366534 RepID=A0ABQ3EM79_9HYPH|nr:ABC transporter permease [Pseudovibrio japonicus]GHB43667.1 spermidine/putrescine ABC transporter permease [Pseudovibrio japonicus]
MSARKWLLIAALLTPGLGLILVLIGTVVYIAVAQSFGFYTITGESGFTTQFWSDMIGRKLFSRSINYSIYVGVLSAIFSVALAYPLALWLRKPFAGSMAIGAVLKAPLLIPGLVAAFLFINIISYNGIVNQLIQWLGFSDAPIRMQNDSNAIGVLILQTWKNLPFALLLLTGAVRGISDEVLDAARDLGAGTWARFSKVIAPLTVSGMQASLVIIFIGAVSDFSFQVIAGPTNLQSMSQLMVTFKDRGDWNSAAVVGVSLMMIALIGSALMAIGARLMLRRRLT